MVGWDEILVPGLPTDAVIQSWRGQKSLSEAAVKGYRGILSWGYYLDHLSPASFHYAVDPLGGPDAAALTPEQASRIMGGEACMWAELVGPETVDSRVWPRTAAIAERLWSAADVTDVDGMYARLETVNRNLEFTGAMHRAYFQPMLDRIAGNQAAAPLRVVADAVEALGLGTGRTGRPTGTMPLDRFVDACLPESELAQRLERMARRFVADPAGHRDDAAVLRRQFESWAANDAQLEPLVENNKLLAEVAPLSKDLSALGEAGIKLLDYLTPPPPADVKPKKLSRKAQKAELEAQQAAEAAKQEFLTRENAELARLAEPPRRGTCDWLPSARSRCWPTRRHRNNFRTPDVVEVGVSPQVGQAVLACPTCGNFGGISGTGYITSKYKSVCGTEFRGYVACPRNRLRCFSPMARQSKLRTA
jgi:hexosaminidase